MLSPRQMYRNVIRKKGPTTGNKGGTIGNLFFTVNFTTVN